jgi:hypothetical protein
MEVKLSGAEFNQLDESSIKIKKAYKSRIAEFVGDATFSWNSVTGTAEIKCKPAYDAKLSSKKCSADKTAVINSACGSGVGGRRLSRDVCRDAAGDLWPPSSRLPALRCKCHYYQAPGLGG